MTITASFTNSGIRTSLPLELWDKVIDDLHDDQLALQSVSLTHRAFLPRCRFYKFSHIYVESSASAERLAEVFQQIPGVRKLVRTLTLSYSFKYVDATLEPPPTDGEEQEPRQMGPADPDMFSHASVVDIMLSTEPEILVIQGFCLAELDMDPNIHVDAANVPTWRESLSPSIRMAIRKKLRTSKALDEFQIQGDWRVSYNDLFDMVLDTTFESSGVKIFEICIAAFAEEEPDENELSSGQQRDWSESIPQDTSRSSLRSLGVIVPSIQNIVDPEYYEDWIWAMQNPSLRRLAITQLAFTGFHVEGLNNILNEGTCGLKVLELSSSSMGFFLEAPLEISYLEELTVKLRLGPKSPLIETQPYEEWAKLLANSVRSRSSPSSLTSRTFQLSLHFILTTVHNFDALADLIFTKPFWASLDELLVDEEAETRWHFDVIIGDIGMDIAERRERFGYQSWEEYKRGLQDIVCELFPKLGQQWRTRRKCVMHILFDNSPSFRHQ